MDGIGKAAETHWEKRIVLAENVLGELIHVVGSALPHTQGALGELRAQWDKAIIDLENEEMAKSKDAGGS